MSTGWTADERSNGRGRRGGESPFTRPAPAGPEPKGEVMADTPKALRTPAQLLDEFGLAAAHFPTCPRMVAVPDAARGDGLVTVPAALVPKNADGRPVIPNLNVGGTGQVVFSSVETVYGVGGAEIATAGGTLNVGFLLYGDRADEAVARFRELGGEAGVVAHLRDYLPGIQNYDSPLVLWTLAVYETLQGSEWLTRIDGTAEIPALHFNPFTASVETLKRLAARDKLGAAVGDEKGGATGKVGERRPAETISKRSTEPGDGRAKLIAALSQHHRYAEGGCLNSEPINNNELARLAGVARSTASAFFKDEFHGHKKYKNLCRDTGRLADALKLLRGEFSPHILIGEKAIDGTDRDGG